MDIIQDDSQLKSFADDNNYSNFSMFESYEQRQSRLDRERHQNLIKKIDENQQREAKAQAEAAKAAEEAKAKEQEQQKQSQLEAEKRIEEASRRAASDIPTSAFDTGTISNTNKYILFGVGGLILVVTTIMLLRK